MSVKYSEILMPDMQDLAFLPGRVQVLALIDLLESRGWIRDNDSDLYQTVGAARATVGRWNPGDPLRLYLGGGLSDLTPPEWPEGEPMLLPELCEDVKIVCSPELLLFPLGMEGAGMPCPKCGDDLIAQMLAEEGEASGDPHTMPPGEGIQSDYRKAVAACRACGVVLDYRDCLLDNGEGVEAPAFKFGVACLAAFSPTVPLVYLDPEFMSDLGRACGVTMRSAGVWE